MTFGRTVLKIAPSEAKHQTGTPKGRQTQGKIRIRSKKMRFRNFVIQQFCLFREKDQVVEWQNCGNSFFFVEFDFFLAFDAL